MTGEPVLVTDSSACLPADLADRVHSVPLKILVREHELMDELSVTDDVLAALRRDETVKTAPPAPGDYLLAVEQLEASEALIVTPAAEFTDMHAHASRAVGFSAATIELIDSRTAAAGQGLVCAAALDAIAAGAGLEAAAAAARTAAQSVRLVGTLPSLTQIERSGRVPSPALEVASRLGVQPVFTLAGGRPTALAIPRDPATAVERMLHYFEDHGGPEASRVVVFHSDDPEGAAHLVGQTGGEIVPMSPAMTVHTGLGVLGISWVAANAGRTTPRPA